MTDTHSDVVDVHIVDTNEKLDAADNGEGSTWFFNGTVNDQPVQILPQAALRHRAVIIAYGTGATILIGSLTKVSNGQGLQLRTGTGIGPTLVVESQSAVWAMSDKTVASVISVWDERWVRE